MAAAVALNKAMFDRVLTQGRGEVLIFEPRSAVYTIGRRGAVEAVRSSLNPTIETCQARGIEVADVDRGGLGTLHLPGQMVIFIALPCRRQHLRHLVAILLQAVEVICRRHGGSGRVDLEHDIGLWSEVGKIASIGLRHRQGIATHGMSVNVRVDTSVASGLVLCGSDATEYDNLPTVVGARQIVEIATELAQILEFEGPMTSALGAPSSRPTNLS